MDDVLERRERPLNGHAAETDSTVLLLLEEGKNRRLLAEQIRGERSVRTDWTDLHDGAINLVVTDARHLERHWDVLRERKHARDGVFFPVLLVSADERLAEPGHRYFELVDEVLTVPLRRAELRLRLNVLDRARGYSETAARRNEELSQINALLAEREGYYRMLFENSRDAIVITAPDGRIIDANPAARSMFGYETGRLSELDVREFYVDPDERARFKEQIHENDGLEGYELRLRRKDGETITCRLSASVHRGEDGEPEAYQLIIRDVTREKQREERLATLATAVNQAPDHIFITDAEGTIEFVNEAFEEDLGYSAEEVEGHTVREIMGEAFDEERSSAIWETLGRREIYRDEGLMRTKDGEVFDQEVAIAPVEDERGRLAHVVVAGKDISSRKAYEEELVSARNRAEEMNELKSAFLANMSHEIRTPLASIIGFADLLAERAPDPLQDFVDLIRTSGERLLVTLNSVLDLAQLESGSMVLRPEKMDVAEVLQEVTNTLRPQAQKSGIQIALDPPEEAITAVQDRGVLTRIVTNLVHNGVKFTEEGEVRVVLREHEDSIVVRVQDSGIGIHPDELPHLFEAFRQESRGLERKFDGSGLGLTITKELVDHVGGEIRVDSEQGRGTTFTVILPRELEEVADEGGTLESAHQWGTDSLPPDQRVLAVDDDESILEILGEMLPDSYVIDSVTRPQEALELASETEYDLVLLDINLKDELNGVDVLEQLRETDGVTEALMIAVTAYALPGDGENFHEAGFDGYVSKPFTQETLRENLIQVL